MGLVVAPNRSDAICEGSGESGLQPAPEIIHASLDRLLNSLPFRSADSLREFLRYVVRQSLDGQGDQIKEYTIGVEVFHRKESFDPRRDNVVRAQARRLRAALATYYQSEGAKEAVQIELPHGTYKPVFHHIPQPAPETQKDALESAGWYWKPRRALLGAFVIAVALLAILAAMPRHHSVQASASTPSIAVLPFRFLNEAKDEEFFSDGLTEDLTDSLAQIPGVRVVAPTSAFLYKGKAVDIREVGRELNVGAVLEGSVQRVDNRVRVTAQLGDTATGLHLWSSSYDREMKDVLAIQREISDSITSALGVRLSESKFKPADQSGIAPNSEAYEDYLKGRYFYNMPTLHNLQKAIGYFQEAIRKDPSFAPAYAALAGCYAAIPVWSATPPDIVSRVRETAMKALALDRSLGEAHVDIAVAYDYDYQWAKAQQEFEQALKLSPGVAMVHIRYGSHLIKVGRLDEASHEFRQALRLDPVSSNVTRLVAEPFYFARRYEEAIRQNEEALELDPASASNHHLLGTLYVMKGMLPEGIAEIAEAQTLVKDHVWYSGNLGWASALKGDKAKAHAILDHLLKQTADDPFPALEIAHVYMGLGDKDNAFLWLSKAVEAHNPSAPIMKVDPMYDSLRQDPRFGRMLQLMNLN